MARRTLRRSSTGDGHMKDTSGYTYNLWHAYRNWRYACLFYSLLLTLAVVPLRKALGFSTGLLELFLAINLLAAVVPIRGRKTRRVLLLFLVLLFLVRASMIWLGLTALA